MKIFYSISSRFVLDPNQSNHILTMLKDSGVQQLNLCGYFWGRFDSSIEDMIKARIVLQKYGFEVGVISVPVGHPGNSLDPEYPTLNLKVPSHWRYRIDHLGNTVYHCGDIEENMIKDNRNAVLELKKAGFTFIFFDDDTRMGNYGNKIQGCFCDDCIQKFNSKYQYNLTRIKLSDIIEKRTDFRVITDWVQFNCDKVNQLMNAVAIEGVEIGIMVMMRGDERHGIDIASLRRSHPTINIRIGEEHFSDRRFNPPNEKSFEMLGMQQLLNLIDIKRAYSETTIFPPNELSPENWVHKVRMALALGIPNIYLMNGYSVIKERYWQYLKANLDELRKLDKDCGGSARVYPIHQACGTHGMYGESITIPTIPFMMGLPVKPVRAGEADNTAEILLFLGNFMITDEWKEKLSKYKLVIFDKVAATKNKDYIPNIKTKIYRIPLIASLKILSAKTRLSLYAKYIRKIIKQYNPKFPYIIEGDMGIIWIKERNKVILLNLYPYTNDATVYYQGKTYKISLQPNEFRIMEL